MPQREAELIKSQQDISGFVSSMVGKSRQILLGLGLLLLVAGGMTAVCAEELLPIRLVALVENDDQGESIGFPEMLFYDYWSSETYLLSSSGRVTIYDQKYFPVVSFGQGRGLINPLGLAVDRRGMVYVCLDNTPSKHNARLLLMNQAFFTTKEIVYADIPELVDFVGTRVAVAESGEIYLAGHGVLQTSTFVAVLTPEGKFLRFLVPPENDAWRAAPKSEVPKDKGQGDSSATGNSVGAELDDERIPSGLKPKSSARAGNDEEEKGRMGPAQISDVKIDRQGRIYLLSREASHIYVLNSQEEYLFKFGEKGGANGKLSNPVSLGIDLERRVIYVCDYMRHTVLCFDYDSGKYIFEFGGRGISPLWFNFPNSVEVDQRGRVVVSDLFNRRVQVIDPNMSERRPLVGLLPSSLVPGAPLPAEQPRLEVDTPAAPGVAAPGAVSLPAVPQPVTPATLPAPQPPGQISGLRIPGLMAPGSVTVPVLPSGMTGMKVSLLKIPLSAQPVAPPRVRNTNAPRELAPRLLKKVPVNYARIRESPQVVPVISPEKNPAPLPVTVIPRKNTPVQTENKQSQGRNFLATPAELFDKLRAMPASVGVYGPVAALLGVGSWLLYTNR